MSIREPEGFQVQSRRPFHLHPPSITTNPRIENDSLSPSSINNDISEASSPDVAGLNENQALLSFGRKSRSRYDDDYDDNYDDDLDDEDHDFDKDYHEDLEAPQRKRRGKKPIYIIGGVVLVIVIILLLVALVRMSGNSDRLDTSQESAGASQEQNSVTRPTITGPVAASPTSTGSAGPLLMPDKTSLIPHTGTNTDPESTASKTQSSSSKAEQPEGKPDVTATNTREANAVPSKSKTESESNTTKPSGGGQTNEENNEKNKQNNGQNNEEKNEKNQENNQDNQTSSCKKGVGFNNADLIKNLNVCWGYNWNVFVEPDKPKLQEGIEYVPMMWGSKMKDLWKDAAQSRIDSANGETVYLLGFNEPDLGEQASLSPNDAAALWTEVMEPFAGKAKLISPAVTNGGPPLGVKWLEDFLAACSGCTIHALAMHWYSEDESPENFMKHFSDAYEKFGKKYPIWVTEFMLNTKEKQTAWLPTVVPLLKSADYIERYAPFGAFSDNDLANMIEPDGTTLTPLGAAFAKL